MWKKEYKHLDQAVKKYAKDTFMFEKLEERRVEAEGIIKALEKQLGIADEK